MSEEEFICISYYDTKDLPIDIHCTKYRNIKYDIQEVLERTDDIDYVISDSRTTKNLLKENEQLKSQLQQKENIIKEAREYIEENKDKYYQDCGEDDGHYDTYLDEGEINKILEILDKENK